MKNKTKNKQKFNPMGLKIWGDPQNTNKFNTVALKMCGIKEYCGKWKWIEGKKLPKTKEG